MTDTSLPLTAIHEVRDSCLCLATQRAARRLARRFDKLFAPLGLTNGQFSLMMALSGQWKPRLGELAEFLAMDHATMTAAVRTLERRGLVVLAPDETDARVRRPSLTPDGRTVVAQALPLWRDEHGRLAAELPAGEAARLAGLLRNLG